VTGRREVRRPRLVLELRTRRWWMADRLAIDILGLHSCLVWGDEGPRSSDSRPDVGMRISVVDVVVDVCGDVFDALNL
jgi:hypothetical protein